MPLSQRLFEEFVIGNSSINSDIDPSMRTEDDRSVGLDSNDIALNLFRILLKLPVDPQSIHQFYSIDPPDPQVHGPTTIV